MEKLVYRLLDIKQSDRAAVGGKAANLGDLARGLTVPGGFCLSSEAYDLNLKHHGIDNMIKEKMAGLDITDIQAVDLVSAEIAGMITDTPVLPAIEHEIYEAYEQLIRGRTGIAVAVRSSATAEDLPDASFAGLQETFLDIEGFENVLAAVKMCWASLWTSRAIHYRSQKGFEHEKNRMAVIIQEMVPAAVSGVMFTANPVSNARDEIRIEAVRGLGEQLVSGSAAGDIYIVKKDDVNVQIISRDVSNPKRGPMLNDYDIRELAHTGLKIEMFYGDYQDVEWAYYQGKFYFLQARPVTTLADEDLPEIDPVGLSKLQREVLDWVAERFPDPILPVDGVVVKILFMAQFEAMESYGYKIEEVDWSRVDRGIFPEFFAPPRIRAGFKRVWQYLRLKKTLRQDPAGEWAAEQVYLLDMLEKLKGRDISGVPIELIIDYLTEAINHFHYFIVMRYRYFSENRVPSVILRRFLEWVFRDEAAVIYDDLLSGLENITIEINRKLRGLAAEAAAAPEVGELINKVPAEEVLEKLPAVEGGPEFLAGFNRFLAAYGERETAMGLGGVGSPTWQDDPGVVIGILKGMLNEPPGAEENREKARRTRSAEAEKRLEALFDKGLFKLLPARRLVFSLVRHARNFAIFRENSHYDVTRGLHVFRILFTELGERFVRRKILREPREIFYLPYSEIKEILYTIYYGLEDVNVAELTARIEARKAEQERRYTRWQMRDVKYDEIGALNGIPASHGIACGPVRVVRDPWEFHKVKKGDILVAHYTNPSWTPLFTTAAGLVAETGGAASHAAIIAREYGIPAVMGVKGATELLEEGELVTVNGLAGKVYRGAEE